MTALWLPLRGFWRPLWATHTFTDDELKSLFDGKEILIKDVKIRQRKYNIRGRLAEQEYNGKPFVGFQRTEITMCDADAKNYASGTWNGKQIVFKRIWAGYRFNDDEVARLLNGDEIVIHGIKGKSGTYSVRGTLSEQEYKGKKYVGFQRLAATSDVDDDRYRGIWNGREVSFKRTWGGHRFFDREIKKLLNGDEIKFHISKGENEDYEVTGILSEQVYNGKTYVGFQRIDSDKPNDPDRTYGVWKGKQISFKKSWGGHEFTDDEIDALLAGKSITIRNLEGKNGSYDVTGKLAKQKYNGREFVGFKAKW